MIENILFATLQHSAYIECLSSCCFYHAVISGNQNVLLICIESEW